MVSAGGGLKKLARVLFQAYVIPTGALWGDVCVPCQMLVNLLRERFLLTSSYFL